METEVDEKGHWRRYLLAAAPMLGVLVGSAWLPEGMTRRGGIVAGLCLVLWLTEVIPLYATTLLLWVGMAVLLGPLDPKQFGISSVISSAAHPVMALFFGGFALSVAASKHGIDAWIAGWMVKVARGRKDLLLLSVMAGTAVLSMWMSNIAAAAMMLGTLGPLMRAEAGDVGLHRALALGVAFAADFGGIGTPIGTGPNLIAIGAVSDLQVITFPQWMMFGVPIAAGMGVASFGLIKWMHGVRGKLSSIVISHHRLKPRGWWVVAIFVMAVGGWLSEPIHGVPGAVVAMGVAGALFAFSFLDRGDLAKLEWDTLLLIAGGISLGELFQHSGLAGLVASSVDWQAMPRPALMLLLILGCAMISAVSSNTAAAAMLVQIGLGIVPAASCGVLVALGASMGVPFVISTPPNAMAYGQGKLRSRDFLVPGLVLMIGGSIAIALVGPGLLRWAGVK